METVFYDEIRFYEQWWLIIDLVLLMVVAAGAAMASFRRGHFWFIRGAGFVLAQLGFVLMVLGIVLAWNLPLETAEAYSTEALRVIRDLPEPEKSPNLANYASRLCSLILPYLGWKVAKISWALRQGGSGY